MSLQAGSKDRRCYLSNGVAKRTFARRSEARTAARRGPGDLVPYRCPACSWYHVGNRLITP